MCSHRVCWGLWESFCGVSWSVIVFYGMLLCIRECWFLGVFCYCCGGVTLLELEVYVG